MDGVEIEVREEIQREIAKTKGYLSVCKKPNTVEAYIHMQTHTRMYTCKHMCV